MLDVNWSRSQAARTLSTSMPPSRVAMADFHSLLPFAAKAGRRDRARIAAVCVRACPANIERQVRVEFAHWLLPLQRASSVASSLPPQSQNGFPLCSGAPASVRRGHHTAFPGSFVTPTTSNCLGFGPTHTSSTPQAYLYFRSPAQRPSGEKADEMLAPVSRSFHHSAWP